MSVDPRLPDPTQLSRRYVTRLVAAISLITLTCVALLIPVPYVTMKPGPVFDTLGDYNGKPVFSFGNDLATGKKVKTYPTDGTLDFTTVSVTRVEGHLTIGEVISAYFSDDTAVVPRSLVYPDGTTAEQSKQESAAQLDGSKDASTVAALRAAGYTVGETPMVSTVDDKGASKGKLEPDDLIRKIDGTAVDSADAAVAAVGEHQPGDVVSVTVTRDGAEKTVDITTKADKDDPKKPRIGIGVGTKFTFPIQIKNNVDHAIGGPSAGTMFALAIYDSLTPGPLTGGLKVAGTGEINADGEVGSIGGIQQKIAGAHRNGAKVFLVPAANCAEAVRGDTHGLKLVKITKLDDAISSLEALAEKRTATVPTCS